MPQVIAAVDLGSNSFHMIVGELRSGQLTIIDRLKETVRLSEGLQHNGPLSPAAKSRALACLSRFGERLRDMHASTVRTAGTSTLRRASDSHIFRLEAEKALGHPIEVVSGLEEARLIYAGVRHSLPPNPGLRLVLDIGGGSTELILGRAGKPTALESLHLGCVAMTERFFPGGDLNENNFTQARIAARLELRPVKAFFRGAADVEVIGTSGTILSTEEVARQLGIIDSGDLTPAAVESLILRVLGFDNIANLALPGLSERRAQVWPGGLAILVELLGVLRIERLRISDGALREGLLYDQLGRLQHEDARERSVQALARRFNVDQKQSELVSSTAGLLLGQVDKQWQLTSELAADVLDWAARLHEIGLDISHDSFQAHGAYIAENADLPGFPRSEQALLAYLVATQRKQLVASQSQSIPNAWKDRAQKLSILLRLAVLLNRSRGSADAVAVTANANEATLSLTFPDGWLLANPLTITDLDRERDYLANIGIRLEYA